jgi:tetratricopeptide (TPR) repeat protein/tRNA A-37 threonylcarbamoyl transferase component Bud32
VAQTKVLHRSGPSPEPASVGTEVSLLQSLAPVSLASSATTPWLPGYEVLGELGRGGMGVVYKARDKKLNRLVALKLIATGPGADPDARRRFQREAEAMASLQHPNIVQVHEIGQIEGTPFCVLEFLDGGSLLGRLVQAPVSAREAAALLEVVARAVHHAHQRGILHRDLKPANILLTADGTPKVGDFGLAKRLGADGEQSQTNAILGTPSFMAPEQARGDSAAIGPAADVYGLGAVLYDALTGRPPFRGESTADTLYQLVTEDPIPPRRIDRRVPRDLETICLKCLEKDPRRRYASAWALADDLRRALDGEPIRARSVGVVERGVKWARRRPAAAALIALAVMTANGALGSGALYARHEARRAEEAEALHREASQAHRRALANFREARAVVDEMLTRVAREKLAHAPQMQQVRRDLLERALRFYEDFAAQEAGPDPETRREAARAAVRAADLRALLGDRDAAEKAYRSGISQLSALADEFRDDPAPREDFAAACNNLGNLLQESGNAEAEELYLRAADLRRRLSEAAPDKAGHRHELALCLANLGALRLKQGRFGEAERDIREALGLLEQPSPDTPDGAAALRERARALQLLGRLLAETGRPAEADRADREACAVLGRVVGRWPDVPDSRQELAAARTQLGDLLRDADPAAAEAAYDEALALRAALVADFPGVPAYRQELAATHNNRAALFLSAGRTSDADAAQRAALAIKENLAENYPKLLMYRRDLAAAYNNRGIFLQTHGRPSDAGAAYRKALALFDALAAEQPAVPDLRREQARTRLNLAALLFATGKAGDAEVECHAALALLARLVSDFPDVPAHRQEQARGRHTLGTLLEAQHRLAEAEGAHAAAAEQLALLARDLPGVDDYRRQLAEARLALSLVRRAAGRAEAGEQSCREALDVFARLAEDRPAVPGHRQALARCHDELAIFLANRDKLTDAEAEFRAAADLQARLVESFPANVEARAEEVRTWQNLAALHQALDLADRREQDLRRVVALCEARAVAFPAVADYRAELLAARASLAGLLEATGRADEARRLRDGRPASSAGAPRRAGSGAQ